MTHASARGDDDAVAGEVEAPSHVEAVAEGAEGGVEAVDVPVGLGAQEHADGSDAEHVGRAVVLALVDFLLADALKATGAGGRKDAEFEETLPVPAQLFNSDRADRFADGGGLDEFAQALGLGRTVVVENPPPLGGGKGGSLRLRAANGVSEGARAAHAHEFGSRGDAVGGEGGDVAPGDVNDGQGMPGPSIEHRWPEERTG